MKHLQITSGRKVVIDIVIKHCRQCPCYHDGVGGEYPEYCGLNPEASHMPSGYIDTGISPQCPLSDVKRKKEAP